MVVAIFFDSFFFALSQFLYATFYSATKTAPALSHRSYRCYIYVTPLGSW